MLHPGVMSRERFLAYGPYDAGKSWSYVNILEWMMKTGSTGRMFIIDTDHNWDDVGHLFPGAPVHVHNFDTLDKAIGQIKGWKAAFKPTLNNNDWLVVDMIDHMWEMAQVESLEAISGGRYDEFLIEAIKAGESIGGDYGVNWNAIKAKYSAFLREFSQWPGHYYACAGAEEVRKANEKTGKGGDSPEIIREYGRLQLKPAGNKKLGHNFRTVMLMQHAPSGRTMNTVKDRGRVVLRGDKLNEFVPDYLIRVAGWRP